uniref:Uncharacterized protein n=1 Tax=Triticum urartu TaxID=4572 RepID=A0A8R7QB36_TRIUA
MPSARTAPSPSAPALLGRPRPFAWSPRMCCSTPAPAGGRRPPRRLCCFAPANPGLLACSAGLCCPGLAVNKQQADWDGEIEEEDIFHWKFQHPVFQLD